MNYNGARNYRKRRGKCKQTRSSRNYNSRRTIYLCLHFWFDLATHSTWVNNDKVFVTPYNWRNIELYAAVSVLWETLIRLLNNICTYTYTTNDMRMRITGQLFSSRPEIENMALLVTHCGVWDAQKSSEGFFLWLSFFQNTSRLTGRGVSEQFQVELTIYVPI